MEKSLYQNILDVFYGDISDEDQFYNKKPLLAHYTNLRNLENILISEEIWFSNPLFMNDLEEVRFGIVQGMKYLLESESVKSAFGSKNRYELYEQNLLYYFKNFEENI